MAIERISEFLRKQGGARASPWFHWQFWTRTFLSMSAVVLTLFQNHLCVAGGSITETFSNAGEPRLLLRLWKAEHHVEFERGKMPPPCLLAEQRSWLLSSWESLPRPSRQPGQGAAGRVTDQSWEKASVLPLPWAAHGRRVMLAGE